jgi:flavin-dependent dehydrogenase
MAGPIVRGLSLDRRGAGETSIRMPATMTIAADGRHSTIAAIACARRSSSLPRRWAFGVYANGIEGVGDLGEMHVRAGYYLGIAPPRRRRVQRPVSSRVPRPEGRSPIEIIRRAIDRDPGIARRFDRADFAGKRAGARSAGRRRARAGRSRDWLLAGGTPLASSNPMTGDGLSLAMRSAQLAAVEALRTLEHGDFTGAVARLAAARHEELGPKVRFNRFVRRLVDSPVGH